MDEILTFVSRDFIRSWYPAISAEPVFLSRVDTAIHVAVVAIKQRLEHVDFVQFVASRILPLLTSHVTECRRAERLLKAERVRKTPLETDEADCQLARYYCNGNLHPALSAHPSPTIHLEQAYLRRVVEGILPYISSANETKSGCFRVLVREIITCRLLQPMADSFSDPDYWNQTIDTLTESMIQQEENLVRKIREALEKQNVLDRIEGDLGEAIPRLRTFDEFIMLIKYCENAQDAWRIRDMIMVEIQKKKAEIGDYNSSDIVNRVKVSDTKVYINRLQLAQKRVEKRIALLEGRMRKTKDPMRPGGSLLSVLEDAHLLSVFTEYMDQEGRIRLLQFWLGVHSLRDFLSPTKLGDDDETGDEKDTGNVDWEMLDTLAWRLYNEFFASNAPSKIEIGAALQERLHFNAQRGHEGLSGAASNLLGAIFAAQQDVFAMMERDYIRFTKSTVYRAHISETHEPPFTIPLNSVDGAVVGERATSTLGRGLGKQRASLESERPLSGVDTEEDDGVNIHKKRSLIDVFKKKRQGPIRRETSGTLPRHATESESETNEVTMPIRRDSSENLERELTDIIHSEENAFGFIRRKVSLSKRRSIDRLGKSRSVDNFNAAEKMEGGKDVESGQRTGSDVSDTSPVKTLGFSFKRQTSQKVLKPDVIKKTPSEQFRDRLKRSSKGKSMSVDNFAPSSEGTSTPDSRLSHTSTQLLLSALDPAIPFQSSATDLLIKTSPEQSSELLLESDGSGDGRSRAWSEELPSAGGSRLQRLQPPSIDVSKHRSNRRDPISQSSEDVSPRTRRRRNPLLHATRLPADSDRYQTSDSDNDSQTERGSLRSVSSAFSSSSHEELRRTNYVDEHTSNILPPMLATPKRVSELISKMEWLQQEELTLKRDMEQAKNEGWAADRVRKLELMKVGLDVEMDKVKTERRQLELEELDSLILPHQTTVEITDSQIVQEHGKDFAVYVLQVQRTNGDGVTSGWVISRRFSEFFALHQQLKTKFPFVQQYEFPSKMLNGLMKLKRDFVDTRRAALEKYLQNLLKHNDVCKSAEFRNFICHEDISRLLNALVPPPHGLTQRRSFMKNIFQNVDESFDALMNRMRSQYPASQASLAGMQPEPVDPTGTGLSPSPTKSLAPSVHSTASSGASSGKLDSPSPTHHPPFDIPHPSPLGFHPPAVSSASASATDAIVELFIELFDLREKNNWLRRQAVALVLQQLFGGTVERRITENLQWAVGEENIAYALEGLRDTYWPNGKWATEWTERTNEQRRRTKVDAQGKLGSLLPELLGGMVGKQNARKGASRLWFLFQNRRLNQQLVYRLFDEIVLLIFPELEGMGVIHKR
ncbi:Intermediate filament protein [Borealophlyctis nickersoniae]|nr:Intermediate filament protein [Borealophlyctis nickersoniae]